MRVSLLYILLLFATWQVLAAVAPQNTRAAYLASSTTSHFVWKRRANMPIPRSDHTVAVLNTVFYIAGGCVTPFTEALPYGTNSYYCNCTDSFILYDRTSDNYTSLPNLPVKRYRHSSGLLNNKLYVFGGVSQIQFNADGSLSNEVATNQMDVFDLTTQKWTSYPDSVYGQIADTTSFILNKNGVPTLYTTGGYYFLNNYVASSATYKLNTSTNKWQLVPTGNMSIGRGDTASTILNNFGYVVGGWTDTNGFSAPLGLVEVFDPSTETFNPNIIDPVNVPGGDKVTCFLGSRLFSFGGEMRDPTDVYSVIEDEVEVTSLDYQSTEYDNWHYAGELPTNRFRFICSPLDNSILLFGGVENYVGTLGQGGSYYPITNRVDEFVEVKLYEMTLNVRISGTSNLGLFFARVGETLMERSRTSIRVSHRQIPSLQSAQEFVGAQTNFVPTDDFYIGDVPLPQDLYNTLLQSGHHVVHVPLVVNVLAVTVIFYNNEQLILDACSLATILSTPTNTLTWGGASFIQKVSSNNSFLLQSKYANLPISVYRQEDSSSMTSAIIAYLTDTCPQNFNLNQFYLNTTILPSKSPPTNIVGSVSFAYPSLFDPSYIFNEVKLVNAAGIPVSRFDCDMTTLLSKVPVPSSLSNIDDAYNSFAPYEKLLQNINDPKAYPISSISFAYVRKDLTGSAENGQFVISHLSYVLSAEGQQLAVSSNHFALPGNWLTYSTTALGAVKTAGDSVAFVIDAYPEPDYAFSTTRRNRYDYDYVNFSSIFLNQNNAIAQLQASVSAPNTVNSNNGNSSLALNIAIAALVLACLGFILALVACLQVRRFINFQRLNSSTRSANMPIHNQAGAMPNGRYKVDEIEVV